MARASAPLLSTRTILWVLAFFSLLFWLLSLPTLWGRLACPFQVQQEEAVNMEFGRVLSQGGGLYKDIRVQGPYLHPYPALYPSFLAVMMRVLPGPWLPGRLPAFLAYLVCGGSLLAWGWRRWERGLSLFLCGLFLLSPTWLVWGSMARMDTMLVLLNFLAFLMLSSEGQLERVDRLRKWPWVHWILAGLLNSAALMMKSSACTLTLALLLTAVRKREWKKAALFLSAVLFPYLLFTAYWQWRTQGAYSLFLQWQAADLHWSGAWSFLSTSFAKECGWLVLALGWTALSGRLPMLLGSQVLLSGVWFLVAACQSTSAENHYMEFFLFAIFALGEGWGSWKGRERKRREWPLLALMMVGLVLYGSTPAPGSPSREEMNAKAQALLFYQRDGDYLALDTDLPYLAGRRIWYQYSGLMPFYRQGTWDPAPLVRDIRSRRFLSVEVYDLPEQTLLPEPVMVAVREDYRVGARAFGRVWYVPRNFIGNLRLPVAGTTTP